MARYYFLASCLPPPPPALGERLSMPFSEVCKLILRNVEPEDKPLVTCCLLSTDMMNIEFFLRGWDIFLAGGCLLREDMEAKRNLPLFIRDVFDDKEQGVPRGYQYDRIWESYYNYAYSLAESSGCRFLIDYFSWEVGLRNSLAGMRALAMASEPEEYQIAFRPVAYDFSTILSHVKALRNPLKAEQFLDEERLKRIFHCEGPDPFSRDAILAILERTRIYNRWEWMSTSYELTKIIGTEAV